MDLSALVIVLLLVPVAGALVAALVALSVARAASKPAPAPVAGGPVAGLRHLAVKRYDAFGDMGGHLSWSLALLDDSGDGVVLTSIHGRSEARTYAKNVSGWKGEQQLSPEEEQAVKDARR